MSHQRRMNADPTPSPLSNPFSGVTPRPPTSSATPSPTSHSQRPGPGLSGRPGGQSPVSPTPGSGSGGKLPVAERASFSKIEQRADVLRPQVASILLMHVCKRILLVRTTTKILIYLLILCVVSLVTDRFPFPKSYFSDKRNVLNQYFVKLGWGWTCSVVGLFVYFTSQTYCCGARRSINHHLCRLAVSTAWWYVSVSIFQLIHDSFGMCVAASAPPDGAGWTREGCVGAGKRWVPFDVSGHTFLLIHCLLVISEEARVVGNGWERIDDALAKAETAERLTDSELAAARQHSAANATTVRFLALAMTLLTLIWELMLLSTILYFHNLPQKLMGAVFAIVGWAVTYRGWYEVGGRGVVPAEGGAWWKIGLPGQGRFRYLKD